MRIRLFMRLWKHLRHFFCGFWGSSVTPGKITQTMRVIRVISVWAESLCYELRAWSLKEFWIYQARNVWQNMLYNYIHDDMIKSVWSSAFGAWPILGAKSWDYWTSAAERQFLNGSKSAVLKCWVLFMNSTATHYMYRWPCFDFIH